MSPWGWSPNRTQGIWRYGSLSLKPFVASAPWITLLILLAQIWFVGQSLVARKGVLVDLPESDLGDGVATGPVALIVPTPRETLVFFDDARYVMSDPSSMIAFAERLAEATRRSERKNLLVLADRRVTGGELMAFTALVRQNGVDKVLLAEKRDEVEE